MNSRHVQLSGQLSDDNNWSDMSDDVDETTRDDSSKFSYASREPEAEQTRGEHAEMDTRALAWS